MKLNLRRVGDIVKLEAEGTPEELSLYTRLTGIVRGGDGDHTHSLLTGDNTALRDFLLGIGFNVDSSGLHTVNRPS